MRELGFRGMDVNGEWHVGLLAESAGFPGQPEEGAYISNTAGFPWAFQVRKETVGEYTGVRDKNSKRMFEGDICVDARGFRFVITWDEENARFLGRGIGKHKEYIRYVGQEPAVTVVSNIYENSELLNIV